MQERIIKLMLLCAKVYQEEYDRRLKNLSEKKCQCFLEFPTIQGTPHIMLVKKISELNIEDVNSVDDIIKLLNLEENNG